MSPEESARAEIDRLLMAAGWHVCDLKEANILATCGVAIREFTLADGDRLAQPKLRGRGAPRVDDVNYARVQHG